MIAINQMGNRRIVVTGMGVISPLGGTIEAFWDGLSHGRSGIRRVTAFDVADMPIVIGGEVDREQVVGELSDKFIDKTDRALVFALCAASRALKDAGFQNVGVDPIDAGCIIGSGLGPCQEAESNYELWVTKGWRHLRPMTIPKVMFNVIASRLSIEYKLLGQHHAVASACASSASALGQAILTIRSGMEDVVLSGGADSPLTPSMYGAWVNMRVLSRNPDPAAASRPFDRRRDGLVLSEGAAMLVLEELEHARRRGARIYGEIIGFGASSDASHLTNPSPEGQARAITKAMQDAHISPEEVDYINAHGTSTLANDTAETKAIKLALGGRAYKVPVSSTKSMTGHPMGAAGGLELVASLLAIRQNCLPPTINLEEPDPECDLDYVPNQARPAEIQTVMSNSFAFGGCNSVVVVRRFEE